jgi:hypothetical protein
MHEGNDPNRVEHAAAPEDTTSTSEPHAADTAVADPPAVPGKADDGAAGDVAADEVEAPALPEPQAEARARAKERGAYYATTPIFYVNAAPHIGHAYTTILVDVVTRFHRLRGDDTFFLTGTDEHGEKVEKAAEAHGKTPQEYADDVAGQFRSPGTGSASLRRVHPHHRGAPQARRARRAAEASTTRATSSTASTPASTACAASALHREGTGRREVPAARDRAGVPHRGQLLLPDGEVPHLAARPAARAKPDLIRPERYRNEVLAMLREPIGDLSISRPRARVPWGIPLPWDEEHVTYVWFDALINYWSALVSRDTEERYWPHVEHFIAKDILKPHGVFWPIMLKAAGIPVYRHLNVHGYWLIDEPQDEQVARQRGAPARPPEEVRQRRIPLLPHARHELRPRRQLHGARHRRAHQRRPGERPRQPAEPHARDAGTLPRRRGSGGRAARADRRGAEATPSSPCPTRSRGSSTPCSSTAPSRA